MALGKQKHGEGEPSGAMDSGDLSAPAIEADSAKEKMRQRLKTEIGQALYKMRKAIVEPVRADQSGPGYPVFSAARIGQSRCRMEADLCHTQSA